MLADTMRRSVQAQWESRPLIYAEPASSWYHPRTVRMPGIGPSPEQWDSIFKDVNTQREQDGLDPIRDVDDLRVIDIALMVICVYVVWYPDCTSADEYRAMILQDDLTYVRTECVRATARYLRHLDRPKIYPVHKTTPEERHPDVVTYSWRETTVPKED
jgi:hypothetical protein